MFSDHPDAYVEFLGSRYRGKAGIRRLYQGRFQQYFVAGRNGPVYGFLLDHPMLQDIIDRDTETHAWGRLRALMSAGTHQSIQEEHPRGHAQWWEGGLYENEYIKENGVWKLFRQVPCLYPQLCLTLSQGTATFLSGTPTLSEAGHTPRRITSHGQQRRTRRILPGQMRLLNRRCSGLIHV